MIRLASVIERFGADYLAQYGCSVLPSQRKALAAMKRCRSVLGPGSYLLVTFTLPSELRPLAWAHQRVLYAALMGCAWETLRTFSQNHKHLQGNPGAVAVLHTHSRKLDFHPHVHVAMPAAALGLQAPTGVPDAWVVDC